MSGTTDKIKGRAKEAVGALMNNRRLKRQGRMEQTIGKVKETVERLIDRAKGKSRTQ
ncbi:MAG: CsbD family protein [Candidatus Binataceae bacterium]|jgi:uncharacterized protein YjbJ (UPF0337 family)